MRKLVVFVYLCCISLFVSAQNLIVEGTAPDLYVTHIVAPKENFYSIGRLYNQAPKYIATFNNVVMENGLTIGQHIKIPLNAQNFDATGAAVTGESLIPLTHIVAKSETLFKISTDHNVNAQSIKNLNNLTSDNISPGVPIIVGHLKVKNDQTNTAAKQPGSTAPTDSLILINDVTASTQTSTGDQKKSESSAVADKPANVAAASRESVNEVVKSDKPVTATNAPVTQIQKLPEITSAPTSPSQASSSNNNLNQIAKKESRETRQVGNTNTGSIATEGLFADNYLRTSSQKSLNSKNGEAATFKSTSGWQDKKYYVLMNDVTPGTIVKVSTADDKFVYAKVLGSLPEMKENNGLLLRVSNSAASYLGIVVPRFTIEVSYYQ